MNTIHYLCRVDLNPTRVTSDELVETPARLAYGSRILGHNLKNPLTINNYKNFLAVIVLAREDVEHNIFPSLRSPNATSLL